MTGSPALAPLLIRWAIRVMIVSGLAIAYQSWAADPVPWLWPLVALYAVVMLAIWFGLWWTRRDR